MLQADFLPSEPPEKPPSPGARGITLNNTACVSQSLQAAVTDYHSLVAYKQGITILQTGKSKIRVPADLVSGEGPLPVSWAAVFYLCPHMAAE